MNGLGFHKYISSLTSIKQKCLFFYRCVMFVCNVRGFERWMSRFRPSGGGIGAPYCVYVYSRTQCLVGCGRHWAVSTSRSKMAVSVFTGVRLISIGDANGDIQRHSEQQPLRLEVKTTQDAALINLSNGELALYCSCPMDVRPFFTSSANNAMQR